MKWDERVGTEIVAKHPEEINIADKTLMQIYSTHEYSGDTGSISLMVGSLNIASYYTGPEQGMYIILLLSLDDDPDAYEGGLSYIARIIIQNLDDDAYIPMIPSLFQCLSAYPTLNEEQRLAITYQDEIKRMIINRLREEGVLTKSELMVWLKDKYRHGFVELDPILIELIRRDIIKETSVKGMPSELIFLINDILMMRRLPATLLKDPSDRGLPSELVGDYITAVKKFFQGYRQSEEDNLKLIDVIINPQVYETLRLLRTSIVSRNELEKLKKKGVEDVDDVLRTLYGNQMIQVFQDAEGTEHYALLSDFYVNPIFPKYMLETVKQEYNVKSKADKVLLEYLNVLEDAYFDLKYSKKKKAKAEEEE